MIEFCNKIKFSTIKFYGVAEFYAMKFSDFTKFFGDTDLFDNTAIKF
ncbi:hypothetical protein [uncultured Campylobacter sp.]|nr:hypothetical protein [uncultured Campylobacter sp.]